MQKLPNLFPRGATSTHRKLMKTPNLSILALALASVGCINRDDPKDSTISDMAGPNVIMVLADTLRADALELYGADIDTAPNLNAWAQDAVVFTHAESNAPWTAPSIASLFTGVLPQAHGCVLLDDHIEEDPPDALSIEEYAADSLSPEWVTLAEYFGEKGFDTAGISKSDILSDMRGLQQGFEYFKWFDVPDYSNESAMDVSNEGIDWLDSWDGSQQFFLYLHYMDAHTPYQAPEPWNSYYTEGIDSDLTGSDAEVNSFIFGETEPTEADVQKLQALYWGEISYWDSQFQRVLNKIDEMGLDENTYVVFLGDHGEQFNEHGSFSHWTVYQEELHVPLVISGPGLAPRTVTDLVQTIDIAPTLAALMDLEPYTYWQGNDQSGTMTGDIAPDDYVVSEHNIMIQASLLAADMMKLVDMDGTHLLYDLNSDPDETTSIAAENSDLVQSLSDILETKLQESRDIREQIVDQ